jgi:hypothetical protein
MNAGVIVAPPGVQGERGVAIHSQPHCQQSFFTLQWNTDPALFYFVPHQSQAVKHGDEILAGHSFHPCPIPDPIDKFIVANRFFHIL